MISSLQEFMLFGDNLSVELYKNKFSNYKIIQFEEQEKCEELDNKEFAIKNKMENNIENNISNDSNIINVNIEKNNLYKIYQFDGLFWCFYAIKNGIMNYEMNISTDSFKIEKEEKFKCIELIRNNRELLKINKIKSISFLENELGNEKKISLKTFFALCIISNINIYYVDGRKVNFYMCDENSPINIVTKNFNNPNNSNKKIKDTYFIDLNVCENKILEYKQNYLVLETFDEKLKSISSYKLSELIEICNKLNIDLSSIEKPNKKDLYSLISQNY